MQVYAYIIVRFVISTIPMLNMQVMLTTIYLIYSRNTYPKMKYSKAPDVVQCSLSALRAGARAPAISYYNKVQFRREQRPRGWPMDSKSADDPDTIGSIKHSIRGMKRPVRAGAILARNPPYCTLLRSLPSH